MPPVMRSVFSSAVNRVGYDPETQELTVEWTNGTLSTYDGVPPDVAEEAATTWSVGTYLHQNIKGQYPHRYVKASE